MFVLVTYPWPVASAHVELSGLKPSPDAASHGDTSDDTVEQRAPHLEDLVGWTDLERLRIQWYRLRLAIADARRRPPWISAGSPVTRHQTNR
jgi:hypothetical protein